MAARKLSGNLKNKLAALAAACLVIAVAGALIRRFFYILDAYYYTAEFHVLFMVKNIAAANMDLMKQYFGAIRPPAAALPHFLLAHLIQNFRLPLSKPILVPVAKAAFGTATGLGFSFIAWYLVGLLAYGLALFFLGDIVPGIQRLRGRPQFEPPSWAGLIFGLGLAVPWLPVALPGALAAVFKLTFKRTLLVLTAGLGVRLLWLTAAPALFT